MDCTGLIAMMSSLFWSFDIFFVVSLNKLSTKQSSCCKSQYDVSFCGSCMAHDELHGCTTNIISHRIRNMCVLDMTALTVLSGIAVFYITHGFSAFRLNNLSVYLTYIWHDTNLFSQKQWRLQLVHTMFTSLIQHMEEVTCSAWWRKIM